MAGRQGGKPQKVAVSILNDNINHPSAIRLGGVSEIAISDDGEEIILQSRGEVFATTGEYSTTKQITRTAAAEEGITISPDGKTVIYASERTGRWNLYKATMTREDELHFAYATLIDEEPLFKDEKAERTWPTFSPDGKEVAFIENRNILKVLNLESGKVRQITDGTQHYGEFSYDWSPDGKWFALTLITNRRDPYSDIGIVSASGDMKIHNITNSGYIDGSPQWVMDGNAVIFIPGRRIHRLHEPQGMGGIQHERGGLRPVQGAGKGRRDRKRQPRRRPRKLRRPRRTRRTRTPRTRKAKRTAPTQTRRRARTSSSNWTASRTAYSASPPCPPPCFRPL